MGKGGKLREERKLEGKEKRITDVGERKTGGEKRIKVTKEGR